MVTLTRCVACFCFGLSSSQRFCWIQIYIRVILQVFFKQHHLELELELPWFWFCWLLEQWQGRQLPVAGRPPEAAHRRFLSKPCLWTEAKPLVFEKKLNLPVMPPLWGEAPEWYSSQNAVKRLSIFESYRWIVFKTGTNLPFNELWTNLFNTSRFFQRGLKT